MTREITARRYWRRVRYHACHETLRFFKAASSENPLAAAIIIIYQIGFIAILTKLLSGEPVRQTIGEAGKLAAWSAAPIVALAIAVFLWELIRAPIRVYRRQAVALARARYLQAPQALPATWLVRFPGGVSDVAISRRRPNFITERERFAIAEDLTFINNSDTPVTLTVALLIQYGVTTLVREPHGVPVERWSDMLRAFHIHAKPQIFFPLNLAPRSSSEGHVVFPIHVNGAGRGVGGDEPANRGYVIEVTDNVSGEVKALPVTAVSAPYTEYANAASQTDLATQGGYSVWPLEP